MQTIWKFPLQIQDRTLIRIPEGAKILCVQIQNEAPCLWALVRQTDGPKQSRVFRIYAKGHQHEKISGTYIGTFQLDGGALVFHVFEDIA